MKREFYGGDGMASDPIDVVRSWTEVARGLDELEVEAVHLATVDHDGLPDVRVVYLREIMDDGFVFYTNYESAKGMELAVGKAAINYYFPKWGRQIRIRGLVQKTSAEQSDAYFMGRPQQSRLGAWMSQQSRRVDARELMENELENLDLSIANQRPPHWGGYKITPLKIEFWAMGEFRIHDRFLWSRDNIEDQNWQVNRLYP